jgi:tetratricopeptide (TPR) repeat protein
MNKSATPKLFNLPVLLLITVVLIGFLLLLFPWKSADFLSTQESSNLKEQFSSRLLAEYHETLRTPNISNKEVLIFSSKLTQKGLWKQSAVLLNEKLDPKTLNAKQKKQLSTIQLRNYLDAYYTASASGEDFTNTQLDVRQHLQDLEDYQNLTAKELVALAKASTNFKLLPQAVKIYFRLAEIDTVRKARWLAEAARWSGHAGDPVSAARAFKAASQLVEGSERYNAYTYAWLKAATKAGQVEEVKDFLDEAKYQPPRSIKALTLLANSSLEAGLPESASDLFAYLAKQDKPEKAQGWLEKAAHWAAETKSYDKAVRYLKQAHALTSIGSDHWSINQRMIEIYVKDEQPEEALALISPMVDANPNSISLLKKGTELAILQKEIPTARRWNQRYLKNQPKSVDALIARTDIETIDENYEEATAYVKRAIKLAPKDYKLRERWAYLEETQGNDKLAMQLWKWMLEKTNEPNYQQQIIRMAQADLKGEGLALLLPLDRKMKLPKQVVNDIFFHLIKEGDGHTGEEFLISHMQQHGPEKDLMENLGKWYGGEKRYSDALATWDKITQLFGAEKKQDMMRFELYWAMEDKDKAYQLWRSNYKNWDAIAKPNQLAIMAEVTWSYEHNPSSLNYYQKLLKLTSTSKVKERTLYHTRLALLYSKMDKPKLAYSAFKRGFMETADADMLLSGMQTAFDSKDYQQFAQLLEMSREQESSFKKMPSYWLMQAALAVQQKQYSRATELYKKALALEPGSKEALAGIDSIKTILADAKKQKTLKVLASMQEAFDKKDFKQLTRLFAASEEKLNEFSAFPQYWLLKSQFNFQQKQFPEALAFYQKVLKLKPDSVAARQGIILSLTQLKNFSALQRVLNHWESFATNNDPLWPNYATAYQAMKQYQASIKWFEMASIKHPDNYIMLLSYAESLDKINRTEDANKVREFGVKQLTIKLNSGTLNPAERKEALFQYLSALAKVGTQKQFDLTYAELDQTTHSRKEKDRLNEIALSWALDKSNLAQLKRLLDREDVQRMKMPLWMTLSIGLKLNDKSRLLTALKQSDKLSTSDHISALLALDRKQQAFEVAKRAMKAGKTAKNRSDARTIAISLANGRVSEVIAALQIRQVGQLKTQEQLLQYKQAKGENGLPIGFDVKLSKATLSNNNLPGKAVDEKDISVGFDWSKTTDQLNGRVGIFDNGKASKFYGNLKYQKQFNEDSNASLEYGFQETPEENSYLRQYGRRNRFKIDYYRQLNKQQAVQLSAWQQEFNRTDNGQFIADGSGVRAAVVHRQNTLNGQWYGGVQGTIQKNSNAPSINAEDALPETAQSAELIAGFNQGTPAQGYSGGLQYSGSVALGKVWPTGEIKAHAEAAVSKELFSDDELSLGVFYDKGSLGKQEDKGLTLKYRKFLDFPVTERK